MIIPDKARDHAIAGNRNVLAVVSDITDILNTGVGSVVFLFEIISLVALAVNGAMQFIQVAHIIFIQAFNEITICCCTIGHNPRLA